MLWQEFHTDVKWLLELWLWSSGDLKLQRIVRDKLEKDGFSEFCDCPPQTLPELAVGRQYRWERYEDKEKQFRDELFFTSYVELAPLTRHQLVVETRFELQPDCFCNQAVCHYNSAISLTEHFSTLLNTTPQIDHNCHVQWKYAM